MKILGTGIDIVEVDRIARAIERWGDGFLKHVFTKEEIDYAKKMRNPSEHFAARFAAKEAVFKAIGNDPTITWKDIQISHNKSGGPICLYRRKNLKKRQILISISHTKHYAAASAIITS